MSEFKFHFAYEQPTDPWTGPYNTQSAAVFAAQRDGNSHRVVHVKSTRAIGRGAYVDTGHVERFPAEYIYSGAFKR